MDKIKVKKPTPSSVKVLKHRFLQGLISGGLPREFAEAAMGERKTNMNDIKNPYRVEREQIGCCRCGHNSSWAIIGPTDEEQLSTTYLDKEVAKEISRELNAAFFHGIEFWKRVVENGKPEPQKKKAKCKN